MAGTKTSKRMVIYYKDNQWLFPSTDSSLLHPEFHRRYWDDRNSRARCRS